MTESNPKTIAIHQPNYIPWLGFFHKMAGCDTFVLLDTVQFPRGRSFAARNRVKTHNGTTYLTIPVSVPGDEGKATYREVRFAGTKWKRKHLKTVEMNYKKAPFFEEVYPLFAEPVEKHDDFVDLTVALIGNIAEYLGIDTQRVLLSDLMDDFGEKTQLIVDICQALDANAYLSGTGGGKEYNDKQLLNEHGIELRYDDFEHPAYPQLWGDFESHLSILDLLFNCGPESAEILGIG